MGQREPQAGSNAGGSSSSESNSAFSSFTHLPERSWIQPALGMDRQTEGVRGGSLQGSSCQRGQDSPPQLQVSLQGLAPLGAEGFRPAQG